MRLFSTSEIFKFLDPKLVGKDRKRAFWNEKQKLIQKQKALNELELEIQRLELLHKKHELLKRQEALKYKQHVEEERKRLGLDANRTNQ